MILLCPVQGPWASSPFSYGSIHSQSIFPIIILYGSIQCKSIIPYDSILSLT